MKTKARICINVTEEVKNQWKLMAEADHRSISGWIKVIIENYLEKKKPALANEFGYKR